MVAHYMSKIEYVIMRCSFSCLQFVNNSGLHIVNRISLWTFISPKNFHNLIPQTALETASSQTMQTGISLKIE